MSGKIVFLITLDNLHCYILTYVCVSPLNTADPSTEGAGQTARDTAQYLAQRLRAVLENIAPPQQNGEDSGNEEELLSDESLD